jgi:RhtB (resistance to homoserine/threonine) family protein
MGSIHHYIVFLVSGIILNVTPGADTLYVLSRSIAQGRRAGVMSVLGIMAGCLVHTSLVAFGLSYIITRSVVLFSAITYAGAAYLVYLGIRTITRRSSLFGGPVAVDQSMDAAAIFRQGFLTNLSNPKVALFFMSFLPQFIDPRAGSSPVPFLILGGTFITTGTLWCLFLAWSSSFVSERLRRNARISVVLQKACGVVFIALGLKLALER